MTYQIPQQLEYKEKIMFGLTFKQLAYALIFGIPAIITLKVFGLTVGLTFAFFLAAIGVCFMFFDFDEKVKDYFNFFKYREVALFKNVEKSFYDSFGIKEIKDKFIIDKTGKKIAVLKINPINYNI